MIYTRLLVGPMNPPARPQVSKRAIFFYCEDEIRDLKSNNSEFFIFIISSEIFLSDENLWRNIAIWRKPNYWISGHGFVHLDMANRYTSSGDLAWWVGESYRPRRTLEKRPKHLIYPHIRLKAPNKHRTAQGNEKNTGWIYFNYTSEMRGPLPSSGAI